MYKKQINKILNGTPFEERLYPVYFNGKYYEEEDCDDLFVSLYDAASKEFFGEGTALLSEGVYVTPDGKMKHAE